MHRTYDTAIAYQKQNGNSIHKESIIGKSPPYHTQKEKRPEDRAPSFLHTKSTF